MNELEIHQCYDWKVLVHVNVSFFGWDFHLQLALSFPSHLPFQRLSSFAQRFALRNSKGETNKTFCVKYHAEEILSLSNSKRQVSSFDSLRAERFGFRNPAAEIFFLPIETWTETLPGSCKIDRGSSFLGVKRLTSVVGYPPHLAPRLKKEQRHASTPICAFVTCHGLKFYCKYSVGIWNESPRTLFHVFDY